MPSLVSLSDERGLANCPAMRPTFTTGCEAGEGQDDGHLQEGAEEVADVVRAVLGEALGAVAALEEERAAVCDFGQRARQLARLTRKNQRRKGGETLLRFGQRQPDRDSPASAGWASMRQLDGVQSFAMSSTPDRAAPAVPLRLVVVQTETTGARHDRPSAARLRGV